jgi:hypothetical protein
MRNRFDTPLAALVVEPEDHVPQFNGSGLKYLASFGDRSGVLVNFLTVADQFQVELDSNDLIEDQVKPIGLKPRLTHNHLSLALLRVGRRSAHAP